jgi:hypothetical protein
VGGWVWVGGPVCQAQTSIRGSCSRAPSCRYYGTVDNLNIPGNTQARHSRRLRVGHRGPGASVFDARARGGRAAAARGSAGLGVRLRPAACASVGPAGGRAPPPRPARRPRRTGSWEMPQLKESLSCSSSNLHASGEPEYTNLNRLVTVPAIQVQVRWIRSESEGEPH